MSATFLFLRDKRVPLKHNHNLRLQAWVLLVGLVLMAIKFFAWWWTNSNAILTDALESIINIVAGAFALFSLWLAGRPADLSHPYGHGKIEFVSAGFEGSLIFLAGLSIIGKAVYNFIYPQQIDNLPLGILLTIITGGINFLLGRLLVRRGLGSHSLTMQASGEHLKSDAYSSVGLLAGLLVVLLTGLPVLDNVLALLFGLFILYTGYGLMRQSLAGILDEADLQLIRRVVDMLDRNRRPDWIDVHNFRTIAYGADLHIDCHLTLPYFYDVQRAHDEVTRFELLCQENSERAVELFVHVDPCEPPFSCPYCRKPDCAVREAPFRQTIPWTLENVRENTKHYPSPNPED